jgi:hypothetical protein
LTCAAHDSAKTSLHEKSPTTRRSQTTIRLGGHLLDDRISSTGAELGDGARTKRQMRHVKRARRNFMSKTAEPASHCALTLVERPRER